MSPQRKLAHKARSLRPMRVIGSSKSMASPIDTTAIG